jgi:hypothetical protein
MDITVRVWDVESGVCLRTLEGHSDWVSSVSLTPDGRRAVTGSYDKTVRVWDVESGACLGVYITDAAPIAFAEFSGKLVVGLGSGRLLFAVMRNLPVGTAILAVQQLPHPAFSDSPRYSARCPVCGQEFAPPLDIVAAIQERGQESEVRGQKGQKGELSCLDLPASAFADPRLLSACPHCRHALHFNSFIVDRSDEAHEASLRRGLAHCRQTPGDDASTLGHLAALAVHLEKMGKSAEAAEFQREHDALAAQLAAKKPASPSP